MSGVHGLTNASGVRSAVLPAPVGRALLLAVLVSGVLVGAWLAASTPVRAEENPPVAALVQGAQTPPHQTGAAAGRPEAPQGQASPGQTGGAARPDADRSDAGQSNADRPNAGQPTAGQPEESQTNAGRTNTVRSTAAEPAQAPRGRTDTARTDTGRTDGGRHGPEVPTGLGKPLSGAVAAVGGNTTRMVFDTSTAVAPAIGARGGDVAQQVRDTVHGTSAPVEDHLAADAAFGTAPTAEEPLAEGADADEDVRIRDGGAVPAGPGEGADASATAPGPAPDTAARYSTDRAAEKTLAPLGAEAVASSAPNTTATGSAPGGATGGSGVAGYLPTTGAPAPAPGQIQAARHVLRSVPAESADEPTFSPD